jgi:hypothetical protein
MQIKKAMLYVSVCILVSSVSMVGQAAEKEGNQGSDTADKSQSQTINTEQAAETPEVQKDHSGDKSAQKATANKTKKDKSKSTPKKANTAPKAPITIEGDDLTYSDETGEVFATGNVVVKQNTDVLMTDAMRGNTKKTEVWIDGKATMQQPGTNLIGTHTYYNYTTKVGNMQQVTGRVGKNLISGANMELLPGELIAHDGTATRCPAKVPDYHMSADKIEIWPGEKMIAYNAKFWIGKTVIYSMPKYQTSLKKGAEGESAFPRIDATSSDGMSIKQHLEYPISDNVAAFADLNYYTKAGFKPQYGLIDREKYYSLSVVQGQDNDTNSNWIKKEPEFKLDFGSHRVGNLPISYTFNTIYGKWTDGSKTSWHQEENLYFTRDTITLSKGLFLGLGTGLQRIHESYNGSTTNSFKFDSSITKQWAPKWSVTAEYHYTKNTTANSLFNYNAADMSREADLGFIYKIDKMNSVGVRDSYDLVNNKIYDQDYTWYRNLHCWQAAFTYRAKRHQYRVNISTTRW